MVSMMGLVCLERVLFELFEIVGKGLDVNAMVGGRDEQSGVDVGAVVGGKDGRS